MARFRGGDEDWLQDEEKDDSRRPKSARRPPEGTGAELAPEEGNAVVAELFPNQASVQLDGSAGRTLCGYRLATLSVPGVRERSPVCVGDRVKVEAGVITGRCRRKNRLLRQAPNPRDPQRHAICANLELLVIVSSAAKPDFHGDIVDRFLVAASLEKIEPLLAVNKSDLHPAGAPKPWSDYAAAGVRILELSAQSGEGLAELAAAVQGRHAAFCGQSGVGKTSLLRKLLNDPSFGRVGDVNSYTGKGRHTTTGAYLLHAPGSSVWMDTPGIMNFALVDLPRAELLDHFPELAAASTACPAHCPHLEAPCPLTGLSRYPSYRRILASLPAASEE